MHHLALCKVLPENNPGRRRAVDTRILVAVEVCLLFSGDDAGPCSACCACSEILSAFENAGQVGFKATRTCTHKHTQARVHKCIFTNAWVTHVNDKSTFNG